MDPVVLAGDIGGTKIHLGLFRGGAHAPSRIEDRVFATHDCPNLETAVADFLDGRLDIAVACFGVAGPVIEGVSHPTNIPWEMRERSLSESLRGVPVRLLNDLEATAWGTLHLSGDDLVTIQVGNPRSHATIAIIAAGTGLGEAGIVHTASGWHVIACEGGHADFAPRGPQQIELLEFLAREFGHVSFERVLSGPGLHNIYRFLRSKSGDNEPGWLSERTRSGDASAAISQAALEGKDDVCRRSLEMFVEIYGAEAANLALKYLALGGVYVCGGIAPKILPVLKGRGFVDAFLDKGRLADTLRQIPARVCMNEDAALIGAAHVGEMIAAGA
jgi:glucokinase